MSVLAKGPVGNLLGNVKLCGNKNLNLLHWQFLCLLIVQILQMLLSLLLDFLFLFTLRSVSVRCDIPGLGKLVPMLSVF